MSGPRCAIARAAARQTVGHKPNGQNEEQTDTDVRQPEQYGKWTSQNRTQCTEKVPTEFIESTRQVPGAKNLQ